jgi:hypothetical protein
VHRQVSSLELVVSAGEAVAGHLAQRSTYFSLPITVWRIEGTAIVRQTPSPAPAPVAAPVADALVDLLAASGLDVVVEDGVVKGEYLGLELARIVDDDPDPRLEVGIGRFDREIGSMMHAGEPRATTLERARELVARHRVRDAPPHPLRDLMVSRWVRHDVMADPSLVGARSLEPLESTVTVANLRDPAPAAARGVLEGGGDVVVVCSGEPDLDLVPVAADIAANRAPGAALVLAVADRHLTDIQRRVAAALIDPPRIVAIDPPF